ncbi:MAG: hypothetical protein ABIS86_14270 [Streptosporangiaceae bacterium]
MENRTGRTVSGLGRALLFLVLLVALAALFVAGLFIWWLSVELPNGADRARKADTENNQRLIDAAPGKLRDAAADGVITAGEVVHALDPHWTAARTTQHLQISTYYRVDPSDPALDQCIQYTVSIPLNASSTIGRRDLQPDSPECKELSGHVPDTAPDTPAA